MDPETISIIAAANSTDLINAENVVEPNTHDESSTTDSMVAVNLSDPAPLAPEDASTQHEIAEEETLEEFPRMENEEEFVVQDSSHAIYEHQKPMLAEEAIVAQRIRRESLVAMQRESAVSMLSAVEEGSSYAASSTIRSRSDSSGTYSSVGSVHVDWDELDKSEEQAPRDEGSDEVR